MVCVMDTVSITVRFRGGVSFLVMLVFRARVSFLPLSSINSTKIKEEFNNLNSDSGQYLETF